MPRILFVVILGATTIHNRVHAQECLVWQERDHDPAMSRQGHAMAYDSWRGVTVLHGGKQFSQRLPDTREWDGNAWTLRSTLGPGERSDHAMAFDASRRVTVMFGGSSAVPPGVLLRFGDTWEWDGKIWSLRSTTGPEPRARHALAYDSAREVTVLFGGTREARFLNDTWEWDGLSWTQRNVPGPPSRAVHAMTYDSTRQVVVLFGGANHHRGFDDTWEWDGSDWSPRVASVWPPGRQLHSMAYDRQRGVSVLVGGRHAPDDPFRDMWEWDGSTWASVEGPSPPARFAHGMTYDSRRGAIVLFGGSPSFGGAPDHFDTWELANCLPDSDDDGITDGDDECPASDLQDALVIGDCDTGLSNVVLANGCTLTDSVGACSAMARHHGDFVNCVAGLANAWIAKGIVVAREKRRVVRCAAQSDLPSDEASRLRIQSRRTVQRSREPTSRPKE